MSFRYSLEWLSNPQSHAISISLPLQPNTFNVSACGGFFAGLLPEEDLRKTIAKNLGISAKNDFSMLEKIGGTAPAHLHFYPKAKSRNKPLIRTKYSPK